MRIFGVLVAALVFHAALAGNGFSQVNDQSLAASNLVVHWESNLGGATLSNGESSFTIWPHGTQKRQVVRVLSAGRQIAEFRADDIDETTLESAIVSGKKSSEVPRIGLDGAKKKADRLVGIYSKVGKKVDVQTEDSQMIYAFAISKSGSISALDAESGVVLWQNQLPYLKYPMLGPGASDKYVVAVNGNQFFAYDIRTGALVQKHALEFVASGIPNVIDGTAVIPSLGGRLVFYDIENTNAAPVVLRIGVENRLGTMLSADRNFLSWPVSDKLVIARLDDRKPYLWTSISGGSEIPSMPGRWDGGYFFVSRDGEVIKTTTDRLAPVEWRTKLGISTNQTSVMGRDTLAVVSEDGLLYAIDTKTGEQLWRKPVQGIQSIANITATHLYAVDTARHLVTIDLKTGRVLAKVFVGNKTVCSNSVLDRIFFVDLHGKITCLREPDAIIPTLVANFTKAPTEEEAEGNAGVENPAITPPPTSDTPADPFGDGPMSGDDAEPEGTTGDADPFGDMN